MYSSFTTLIKFTPKYFALFGAIISGIVLFISFLGSLLLVYRNATDILHIDFVTC
jgi:hypothetical protein